MIRLPLWTRDIDPAGWLLVGALTLAFLAATWWFVLLKPALDRRDAAEARAAQVIAQGQAKAGGDAIIILDGHHQTKDDRDQRVKESEDAIRNAPAADRDRVTIERLCQSKAASRRPECLQPANP